MREKKIKPKINEELRDDNKHVAIYYIRSTSLPVPNYSILSLFCAVVMCKSKTFYEIRN